MAKTRYLVLNYPGPGEQSAADWERFFTLAEASGRFSGGSALGARTGLDQQGRMTASSAAGGYFIFTAESVDEVAALLRECPILLSGGRVDIIATRVD